MSRRIPETAAAFAARTDVRIAADIDTLQRTFERLEALRKVWRAQLETGLWEHAGDFGRIRETLADLVEQTEWIRLGNGDK